MRQSHLIISNAAIMWLTRILQVIPQLIMVPYLIGTIGENGYGTYALVWSLMMSIEQLQRSLQSGVVKYSAGFLAQGRMDEVNKVISSSFVYSIILAVVACAGTLVASRYYKDPTGQTGSALVIVGIMALFLFPLTPYIAIIQSRQRYYVGAIAQTVSKYLSLLVVILWFHALGPSVGALIIIMVVMLFLAKLAQVPIAWRIVPGLQNRFHLFDRVHFRLIASFGAATVLASLCLAANSTGIRWLMGSLVSNSFVAHLAIMLMPSLLMRDIITGATITVMPATSAYVATGNQQMLKKLMIRGMRYTAILSLAGLITASLLMRNVLAVWVGPHYSFLIPYALVLIASGSFMQSTSVAHHMLKGMGKLRVVVSIYAFGLVIVPFGLILAVFHNWQNPYLAVTVGLAAGQLVCGCLNAAFCAKVVNAGWKEVFVPVYSQPLLVTVPIWLGAFGFVIVSDIQSLVGRIYIAIIAIILFFSVFYILMATAIERLEVRKLIQWLHAKLSRSLD